MCLWYGIFFVMGNYEYYVGVYVWIDEFCCIGLMVLLNEYVLIECGGVCVVLVGVIDFMVGGFDFVYCSDFV